MDATKGGATMEFCSHCRALRKTRKSSRNQTVRQGGATSTIRIDTYMCAQCNHTIRTEKHEAAPARPAAPVEVPAEAEAAVEEPAEVSEA
jgi:hypothetical protein